jgi:hypothetical protein
MLQKYYEILVRIEFSINSKLVKLSQPKTKGSFQLRVSSQRSLGSQIHKNSSC